MKESIKDGSQAKIEKFNVTDEATVLRTPIVDVISATLCSSASGRSRTYYRFDFPGWVNVVAVTPKRELILIRQYRYGNDQIEVEIPGGAVERGESALDAGVRELLEETGFQGTNARIIGEVCPNPAIQGNPCSTVLVEDAVKIGAQRPDDMEEIEVLTVPVAEVFQMVRQGTISHGLVLNGLMFYAMESGLLSTL